MMFSICNILLSVIVEVANFWFAGILSVVALSSADIAGTDFLNK